MEIVDRGGFGEFFGQSSDRNYCHELFPRRHRVTSREPLDRKYDREGNHQ
jgi:hypothetical protein